MRVYLVPYLVPVCCCHAFCFSSTHVPSAFLSWSVGKRNYYCLRISQQACEEVVLKDVDRLTFDSAGFAVRCSAYAREICRMDSCSYSTLHALRESIRICTVNEIISVMDTETKRLSRLVFFLKTCILNTVLLLMCLWVWGSLDLQSQTLELFSFCHINDSQVIRRTVHSEVTKTDLVYSAVNSFSF